MDNLVTISNVKENVLEFNVEVKGIDSDDMAVRFVIEAAEMNLGFDSEQGDMENLWTVKIPALTMLDTTSYSFRIDVIVDGYHFDAMQGAINVVGSHDIYATKPENITLSPSKKQKKPKAKDIKKKVDAKKKEHIVQPKKIVKPTVEEPTKPAAKPNRKFEMTPLKVQDGKELFDTLNKKKVNHVRKTDDKLDDKIVDLMTKAKGEKKKADEKTTPKAKKGTTPKAKKVKENIAVPTNPQPVTKKTAVGSEIILEKEATPKKPKKKGNAKSIAEKIIQSVTGIGSKKETPIIENTKDDKMKAILAEDAKAPKKKARDKTKKEAVGIKKIGKDNTITEVDGSKEQKMKDVLKEIDESDNNKSVTTRPFKKKDTIH